MSTNRINIKRGDTYELSGTLTDDQGSPINLTGWQIASQIRTQDGTLVAVLVPVVDNAAEGAYRLTFPGDNSTWPVGFHHQDVEYTDSQGKRISTETITVNVVEDITR